MPIVLNGSTGVITGIPVGGLPDGIVDTDMIANNAVTSAKATGIAGGKVLQVINNSSNTNVTTSGSTISDLLTTAITPASSSNKIFVLLTCNIWIDNGAINAFGGLRLYRGTAAASGTSLYSLEGGINAQHANWQALYLSYLDSPNTTSAQSYTMSISRFSSYTNSAATDGKTYQMTLMEIAA